MLTARLVIEVPGEVFDIKLKTLCEVRDGLNNHMPLSSSLYESKSNFVEKNGLYFVEFILTPVHTDEEFGSVFLVKLETLDGKLLVESEKKAYYIFKASKDEGNSEPKVAMSIDSSLFPEKDRFDEKVLITGGCGFLGRHLVNRFCELGYLVFIIDNLEDPDSVLPNEWPILKCKENQMIFKETDYLDFLRNDATFTVGDVQLNVFVHLASFSKSNSLDLDSAAFQFAAKSKPERMIFFIDASLFSNKNESNGEFDLDM